MASVYKGLVARAICATLAVAWAAAAYAQEKSESNLDVTIRLLPENAVGPEDITRRIELPPAAARPTPPRAEPDEAAQPPADDKEKENKGRADEAADQARERGREVGKETADQARENRENAGRPDDKPGRGPPDEPGPRGPPDTPPGRP